MRVYKKQIALSIISAGSIALFFALVYLPMNKEIKNYRAKNRNTRLFIQKVAAQSDQLSDLDKKLSDLKEQVEIYRQHVPEGRNLGQFLQDMAALMDEYELKDQSIKPGAEINVLNLKCIPLDMRCTGKLSQMFEFYKSLQSMDRLIRINSVNLVNDKNFNGNVTMETKAAIFYREGNTKG